MALSTLPPAPPAAISTARSALDGLSALFNMVDPSAWSSLARPTAPQLADLVHVIAGKFDEGLVDLGFDPSPGPSPPPAG